MLENLEFCFANLIVFSLVTSNRFLDFGLLCRMEKKHQFAMLASIVHIVNGDWSSLLQALAEMDVVRPGTNIRRVTMVSLTSLMILCTNYRFIFELKVSIEDCNTV